MCVCVCLCVYLLTFSYNFQEFCKQNREKSRFEAWLKLSYSSHENSTSNASFDSFLSFSGQTALTERNRLSGLNSTHLPFTVLRLGSPRSRCQHIQFLVRALFLICGWSLLLCVLHSTESDLSFPLLIKPLIPS